MLAPIASAATPTHLDIEVFAIPLIAVALTVFDWQRRKRLRLSYDFPLFLKAFFISLGIAYGVFDALIPSFNFAFTVGLNGSSLTADQVRALDLSKVATVTLVGMLISMGWLVVAYLDLGREEDAEARHE